MSQHRDLDVTKRDRFELLSAYLDGEVSPAERRLVAAWLTDDPETQCLYRRLLRLRQGFQGMQHHRRQSDAEQRIASAVVCRLNQRLKFTCMAGATAVAFAFIGAFSGALNDSGRFSLVQTEPPNLIGNTSERDSLEIALDQPPILIPKPATSESMDSVLPEGGVTSAAEPAL